MTHPVSRRSTLRLLGGAITVAATVTGGLAPPAPVLLASAFDPERPYRVLGTGRRDVWVGASAGDLRLRTRAGVAR